MTEQQTKPSAWVPAIVQDRLTGSVRTLAWIAAEDVLRAPSDGQVRLAARPGGEVSVISVHRIVGDCDGGAVLVLLDGSDSPCPKGHVSCFERGCFEAASSAEESLPAVPFLDQLARTIAARRASTATRSYTKSLLEAGPGKIGEKLREEAAELATATAGESDDRVANEAADVLYHLLVALELRGVALRRVIEVLAARSGTSGHQEKASRPNTART